MNEGQYKLSVKQALPLFLKVKMTEQRVFDWYTHWGGQVYVSFSGGNDSRVLLDIARALFPDIPAVFCNTGLEFPEIVEFVKTFDNVEWIRPAKSYRRVLEEYGYPIASKEQSQYIYECRNTQSEELRHTRLCGNKHGRGKIAEKWMHLLEAPFEVSDRCCHIMKKQPAKKYEKRTGRKPILGTMAVDSELRKQAYKRDQCNAFDAKRPTSKPMSFWVGKDVTDYIALHDLEYCKIYDMGEDHTGCMFCAYGQHLDDPNRFQRMKKTHPKKWTHCMDRLGMRKVLEYVGIPCEENQMEFDFTSYSCPCTSERCLPDSEAGS